MHTLTDTIEQHTDAIKQRLEMTEAHLQRQLERGAQRLIVRMTLIVGTALIVAFVAL